MNRAKIIGVNGKLVNKTGEVSHEWNVLTSASVNKLFGLLEVRRRCVDKKALPMESGNTKQMT